MTIIVVLDSLNVDVRIPFSPCVEVSSTNFDIALASLNVDVAAVALNVDVETPALNTVVEVR